ncbi:cytochrome b561 and DOMON domain-containing protein At3g61750-like [Salvia splendens]|uniref:cytochrome b561 and DOMON domain-containing protein At3g61750-like n=1 Tax=Salvia splendens TaxID=180675 RepID=UPI001C276CA8|nr:cytochrome b561 and DOMON domain-containing protein At3g61750-like [Salvia splendens]
MEGRWRVSKWAFIFASLMSSYMVLDGAEEEGGDGRKGLCSTDLTTFLPFPYSNLPNMVCHPLWNSYLLRYSKSKDNEITIVLSTIYTSGWVGIGFSRDGKMLNSSCIVGWVNQEGQGRIKQYHIKGFTPSEIKPDRGELPLTNVPPYVAVQGATIYLSFQLKFNTTLKTQPLLLAFSTKPPHHHRLTVHQDKTTIYFDFSAGKTDDSSSGVESYSSPSPGILKDRRTHGTLAVLGWGFFLPTGAILARYLSRKDNKVWYYFHVPIQFIGFLLGVAAVIVGVSLYTKMHVFFPAHRGIGIFLLVITILQVLAFFTRPNSDSKYRRYWNWYHNWVGRICLFFGAVNILLGIHIADAGQAWKIGYGFLLGFLLVTVIVLEALLRLRRSAEADKQHPPFSINSIDREISL